MTNTGVHGSEVSLCRGTFEQRTSRTERIKNRKIRRMDVRVDAKILRQGQAQHIWETQED